MNNEEARAVLAVELAKYREQSYEQLKRLLKDYDAYEVSSPSGVMYQVEIQAVWDDKPEGPLRILGAIDDGGLRAFVPLCEDFIINSDGSFVGE